MPNYRRLYKPGGTYFFTVNLADRGSSLLVDRIDDFRSSLACVIAEHPVTCDAFVILPDHLHCVWTLPVGDSDYSVRWKKIKSEFSKLVRGGGLAPTLRMSASKARKGEAGFWQRRFWEHHVRDQADYDAHIRYCWNNPVKHGYVENAEDWPYSSMHRDKRLGKYG